MRKSPKVIDRAALKTYVSAIREVKGVQVRPGLTANEVEKIEAVYDIRLPQELKDLLMYALPTSSGFYNWRDFSDANIAHIKSVMEIPAKGVREDPADMEWGLNWGEEPDDPEVRARTVLERLETAPKLIPIFTHRYVVSTSEDRSPVYSIRGTDIICYGETVEQYLKNEFIHHACYVYLERVPDSFWKDVL